MANSCVVVTPSLRAKASEYNVAIDDMSLAVQSWLDLGNRIIPETSEKLNEYLNKYFNVGTEKIYTDKKAYDDAVTVWDRYNSKTFDTVEERNRVYNDMVKCFGKENVSKFKNAEGKYEIKIAEPILTTETTLNNSTEYSPEMLDIKEKALRDGTFMKAPNGKPTNLTEKQWLQVRTKAFKNWFGDWENNPESASKVVDENGEPLVVYHGTKNGNFNAFDYEHLKKADSGFFFSSDKEYAKQFGDTRAFFLNIKNPNKTNIPLNLNSVEDLLTTDYINGTDGIIGNDDKNTNENINSSNGQEYVALRPNQIKSATDNVGSFSKENDNIYYQKSMLDELKKLKAINRPLEALGSDRNIEKYLSRTIDSTLVKPIIKAIELDPSLKKLTPYDLFQTISKKREEDIANEYNEYIQKKIDKKLEEHLISYLKKYNIEYDDLGEFVKEYGVDGLYDVLGKTIHVAKEGERNYLTVPEEFSHAFVELMGSVYKKNRDKFPENKDFSELFDGVENTSIYQQVFEQYKDVYTNEDGSPNIFKIKKEAIGQALAVSIANKWENKNVSETSFWDKLKEWFQKLMAKFKGFEYINFETLIDIIAEEVINNDHSRLEKINSENYNLLDYSETIANQNKKDGGKAVNFMQYFTSLGNIITGSLSYRKQGTVYRSKLDSLHDIDMIVPYEAHGIDITQMQYREASKSYAEDGALLKLFMQEPYFKQIKEKYPKIKFCAAYRSKGDFMTLNAIYCEDESISEKFAGLKGSYASRLDQFTKEERDKIYLFDFFINKKGQNTDYIEDTDNNLKLARFDVSFKEKQFSMGRAKDIYDYQMWKLYDEYRGAYIPKKENMMFQLPPTHITYTPKGKEKQTYTIVDNHIYNKKGEEVFKEDSVDRNKIFANVAVQQRNAVVVEYRNNKYVVDKNDKIVSVTTGKVMQWGNENGDRKAILELAKNKLASISQQVPLPSPETKINIYAGTNENADLSNFAIRPFNFYEEGYDRLVDYRQLLDPEETTLYHALDAILALDYKFKFKTVEGAFQAAKLGVTDEGVYSIEEKDRLVERLAAASGNEAKNLGKNIKGLNVKAWDTVSSQVMKFLIKESFIQNPQALQRLLATGNATLTHTQDKGKWGTEFPRILMEVREELRNNTQNTGLEDTTTTTSKLEEASQKFEKFKNDANDIVRKGPNFEQEHKYIRKDKKTGEWVEVEVSVTKDINRANHKELVPENVEEREFTGPNEVPSTLLGNTNDYVARQVFAFIKSGNSIGYVERKLADDPNVKNLTDNQLNTLISSIQNIIGKLDEKFGGKDNWRCSSEEVPLLGERVDHNGKKYYVAGIPDLIIWDNAGKFYILDFKTIKGLSEENSNAQLIADTRRDGTKYLSRNRKWFAQTSDYKLMITSMSKGEIKPEENKLVMASTLNYPSGDGISYEDKNGEVFLDNKPITESTQYKAPQALMLYEFGPKETDGPFHLNEVNSFASAKNITEQTEALTPEEKQDSPDLGSKNETPNRVEISVTKLNPIAQQQDLRSIPASERQFLSNFIYHKTSEIITELVNLNDELDATEVTGEFIMNYLGNLKVENLKTREDVLNKIGIKKIFEFIQDYYFNVDKFDDFEGNYMNIDMNEDDRPVKEANMRTAYSCFKELCRMAYSKFIFYEGISLDDNISSDALSYEVGDESLKVEQDKAKDGEKDNEAWQIHFRNVSAKASLSGAVKRFLGNIAIKTSNGERIIDDYGYGLDTYVDTDLVISKLQAWLTNCETLKEMIDVLNKQKEGYAWVNSILEVLDSDEDNPIKQQFFQNFRKDFTTYSVIYKEWDKDSKKYNYKINIINTKGAEQAVLDVLKANFEMDLGQKILISNSDKGIKLNEKVVDKDKQLFRLYASDSADNPFSRSTTPDVEHFKALYDALVDLGIPKYVLTYKDFINAYIKKGEIEGEMAAIKMMKEIADASLGILNEIGRIDKGPFSPTDSSSKIQGSYYKIIKSIADYMDNAIESSTYENGKMYYSYCNPSYMGKMIRNLRDASGTYSGKARNKNAEFQNSEFGKYVIENYGKYKFFKRTNDDRYVKIDPSDTTQIWWTEWLELLCNDTNSARTSVLAHKVQLTFDKDAYTDLDELHELTSLILEYRNNGDNNIGWFRVPILGNKPSNEFIRFLKKTDPALVKGWGSTPIAAYKQQIIEGLYGTFQQELMRIRTIFERADNASLSEDSIKNFDIPKKVIDKLVRNSDGTIARSLENLSVLIGGNGKNPSGIAFQYLTLFNDLFTSDISSDANKIIMQNYIIEKLKADSNNIVNGRQVNDSASMSPFADLVKGWIDKKFMEDKKEWRKLGLFDETEDGINKHLNISTDVVDKELENYYWNDLYASINIIQLTVTDLSFNKNVEDFQKRFPQVHAPSLRFDEYAKYKNKGYKSSTRVAETSLGENAKAYHRTMTLKDEEVRSEMIAFVDNIFTDLAESSELSQGEKEIIKSRKESIKDSLKKVNVADAQGFTCPTAYRKKMLMMGQWSDALETAYIKIKSGNFTPEDIKPLLLQPLKPFVYTKINKKTGVDTLGEMPVPVQNKNSEYMLFVAGAMAQSGRLKDSKIAGIYEFMEESAETDGIYNGIGIDTIQFESAVKSGLEGKIDLSNEALKKYKAEHNNPNMSDREAVKAILKEKSTYDENTASIKGNYGSTGKYNMTYVHEVPFEDYGIQQNVPAHFQDHSQAMGSQIRILNPSDLTGSEYIVGKEKMTAQQLRDEYFHITARNIELSINKLKEDFMLDSNVREERVKTAIRELLKRDTLPADRFNEKVDEWVSSNIITKGMGEIMKGNFKGYNNHGETKNSNTVESITNGVNFTISNDERTNILYNLIKDEILKDGKYGYDMLQSISLVKNSNGELEFNIPLCDSTQTIRIQQMLNSIVKSRVNKQRIKGGPVVQASVFGQTEDLKIRLADSNGNELLSFSEYTDLDKLTTDSDYNKAVKEYQKYLKDNHALLKHFEIYVTCPSEELENLLVKAARAKGKDLFYYLDNPQEAVKEKFIDESMLRMIGYRIPTEDKYSMQPCKVKRFLPRSAGEAVMLPKEITWMSGSDFDIDKLYIETRTYDFNGDTFDDPKDEFDINNNKLFEMQWGVLTNPDTLPKMFNPGGFDMQKSSVRRLEIMEAVNVGKIELEDIEIVDSNNHRIHLTTENIWENLEKLSLDDLDDIIASHNINNRNIIFASTQVYFHKQNMTAGKLIGIFANNNTSHSFVNIHNEKHKDNPIEISFGKRGFTLNGINYYGWGPIDNLYSNDGVTPISKVIASYLAASVDAVKDNVLSKMNLNTLTTGPAMMLTRMGVDSNTVGLFLRQPIIMYVTREYFKANSEKFTRIEDVIDKVCDDLGLTSDVKNPALNNAELSKNVGKEITLNHMKDDKGEDTKIIEMRNISQSNEVLSIFKTLCSAASDLNDLTFCTKFNSMTNVAGPKISDNEITVNRVKDFFDRVEAGKTIFNKAAKNIISGNEMLQAFYSVFEGNNNILDEMFRPYFPQYSESYNMAKADLVRSLPKGLKLNNEVLDKLADFMSVYRMLDNGVFKIDRNKYNYFISQSPSGFISKVAKFKETLKDNKLISMLEITPSSKRCNQVTINAKGGGLSADQQDEIKTAWNSLIESEDIETRRFGVELAEYFMIRGGFGFNPKTVMHLMTVELKESIVNYRDIMGGKSIVNGTMDTTKNWSTDYHEMLYQFIRNMASVRKLSYKLIAKPEINKEDIGTSIIEKTTDKGKLLLIQENSDIYNELGKDNLWFEYSNQVAFSTEETYSDANGTYKVYKLTDKLGIGNNFLEIYPNEGYDTKSLFNSGAGRIDAEFIYSSDESDSGEKINSDVDDLAVEVLLDLEGTTETDSFDEKLDDALYKLIDTKEGITESTIEKVKERVKNYLKDKC